MKMRLIVTLSCLLLAFAAPAASSKDASYTQSTAVVVRAHPWLTRGLDRESLIGIRFWGGIDGQFGGPLQQPIICLTIPRPIVGARGSDKCPAQSPKAQSPTASSP